MKMKQIKWVKKPSGSMILGIWRKESYLKMHHKLQGSSIIWAFSQEYCVRKSIEVDFN